MNDRSIDPQDEIRTVTVLFADVAGSTAMAAQLGLETVKEIMDQVFDRLYTVILHHGGTVDKYIGDCVMALFGAPLAFGDDATRAVRAGLAILRVASELGEELERRDLPSVRLRVGINTGPVIAGALGAGPGRRYTVLGHAVNVAAHLQQEAPVGGVLLGHETFRRIRGLFTLREVSTAVGPAYQVLAERAGGLWIRPREILGREIETVGRVRELDRLMELARATFHGSKAALVLVVGDPGMGKSRLLFEFLSRLEEEEGGVRRLVGFAHPLSAGIPFSVAAEAVRRGLDLRLEEGPQAATAKLRAFLAGMGRTSLETDLLILSRVLGLSTSYHFSAEETGPHPLRVLDLLAELVDWLCRRPTLLVLEDLHWCDSSSLALIEHLLRRLAARPLLLVALSRPEFVQEHPELLDGPERHRLDVGPLDREALASLLRQAVGEESGARLLELIESRSLGNPYHVEELLRSLEERRVLQRRIGGWELCEVPAELEIPPGVEAITQARIDNLTPAQRRLLCQAAAAGRAFWEGLLAALSPSFSPQDLSALVQRELVVPRQESSFAGEREYGFGHDLTRDVAYRMLPEYHRTELHRRIAAWIMARGEMGPKERALVARHLDLGGQPEEAAGHLSQAGDAAFAAAAFTTAALHYSRALELAEEAPRRFELLAGRERVLNALGRWADQRRDALEMLELAEELGEEGLHLEALLRVGRAQLNLGDHAEAHRSFVGAHALANRLEQGEGQARSLRWLAMYHFNRSEHLQARDLFEQALLLADGHQLETLAAELAYELGVTTGTIGDYPRAVEVSRRALMMFREQGNRYQESFCLGNLGCFHVYLGEYAEAVTLLEEAAQLGRQMGIPLAEASAQANLGNAWRLLGQPRQALELEDHCMAVAREIGDVRLEADALIYGALAALDAGELEQAESLTRAALARARQSNMPGTEAAALMSLSRLLGRRGELEAAVRAATEAVVLLDRLGTVEGFEQEILLVHAQLCRRLERCSEAEQSQERAWRETERKASFIVDLERRQRFLAEARRRAEREESSAAGEGSPPPAGGDHGS